MGNFLQGLFDGMSLDTLIVYLLALRGALAGASASSIKLPEIPKFGKKAAR